MLAPIVAAESSQMLETWENSVVAGDYCTVNADDWDCDGTPQIGELRIATSVDAGMNFPEIKVLSIAVHDDPDIADDVVNMYREFGAPADDYVAYVQYNSNSAQSHAGGDWVLMKLTDVNGNRILQIGMQDADANLDVTNGTGFFETSYAAPNSYRNYTVTVDVSAETYDFKVKNSAGSVVYEKLGLAVHPDTTTAKATRLTVGSLFNQDNAQGRWDHIKVYTP